MVIHYAIEIHTSILFLHEYRSMSALLEIRRVSPRNEYNCYATSFMRQLHSFAFMFAGDDKNVSGMQSDTVIGTEQVTWIIIVER